MTRPTLIVLAALSAALLSAPPPEPPRTGLDATLWIQTSAEYRACARQTWSAARAALDEAVRDHTVDAVLGRPMPDRNLHAHELAVIVDVDETVLDNSPFQARLGLDGEEFTSEKWAAWVEEAAAGPVPGAVETLRHAARLGVRVFYVTNRDAEQEDATRRNLERWGFPFDESEDVLLMRGEKEEWGPDKTSRRRHVARTHRILLLAGDDLNDFIAARELTPAERREVFNEYDDWWGERWFMLPNPNYGSWMRAVTRTAGDDVTAAKLAALDPRR